MSGRMHVVARAALAAALTTVLVQATVAPTAQAASPFCGKSNQPAEHNGHYDTWRFEQHFSEGLNHKHVWRQSHTGGMYIKEGCTSDF